MSLACNAHTHARYSKLYPPSGAFACWSTQEAKDDLVADGWFEDNGFPAGA